MASRSGPRAPGTDGSDYTHREKIVSHYKTSADLKTSVRKCLLPHMLLTFLMGCKFIAVLGGSTYVKPLDGWELGWCVSGVSAYVGFGSLSRNDVKRLFVYVLGNAIFGIVPLVFGAISIVKVMQKDFKNLQEVPENWRASPVKMSMIAVCFSWQVAGLVQSIRLIRVWQSMSDRKRKE